MGGLDARYMLARLDMARHVAALVTVSTPHRGSSYADWCVRNLGRRLGLLKLMGFLGLDVQGILDLTTDRCARFNEQIPDVPGVAYYSVSAASAWQQVPPFALHAHHVVYEAEGPNDSLVSVRSARWGEHLCTWAANHWHAVNRRFIPQLHHGDDIVPQYLSVIDTLMARGLAA